MRGEAATPAADAYSLGVMLVYLLTGIWYTPGSKVFRLLATLEYPWADVLRRLLDEDPAGRPKNLVELAESLRVATATPQTVRSEDALIAVHDGPEVPDRPTDRRRFGLAAVLGAAVLVAVILVVTALIFLSSDPAPSSSSDAVSSAVDGFDSAFSARGIYKGVRK